MLLKNQWVMEEIKKHLETNENVNTTYQNLSDTAKEVLRKNLPQTIIHQQIEQPKEIDKFIGTHNFPGMNHEEIENLNRLITNKEIEVVIWYLPTNKSPGPGGFINEFYKTFKNLIPMRVKLSQKIKEEGSLPNTFKDILWS